MTDGRTANVHLSWPVPVKFLALHVVAVLPPLSGFDRRPAERFHAGLTDQTESPLVQAEGF